MPDSQERRHHHDRPRGGGVRGRHQHSVVPPYVLEQISLNGSPEQRRSAVATLLLSDSIRAARTIGFPHRWA